MNINQYIKEHRVKDYPNHVKKVICADGFEMSVQASPVHYCSPQEQADAYTEVEIGFPSQVVAELMPYCDDPTKPLDTVYGYVPVEVVDSVIEKHGGFAK